MFVLSLSQSINIKQHNAFISNNHKFNLNPYRYAVTDRAWRTLRDMNTDQCVLISGEAGSGKTEAAKLTLQYIAAVTGYAKEFHNIKYQLLQSNPVLEGRT